MKKVSRRQQNHEKLTSMHSIAPPITGKKWVWSGNATITDYRPTHLTTALREREATPPPKKKKKKKKKKHRHPCDSIPDKKETHQSDFLV